MKILPYLRLLRATLVLARAGIFAHFDLNTLPPLPAMLFGLLSRLAARHPQPLGDALNRLGPSYVKFGQALATRPDIVGEKLARELSSLHDRMPPFDVRLVPGLLAEALGARAADLTDLSPPIAAASVAQVHKATLIGPKGPRTVAVKILRPDIARRFARDFENFRAGARLLERLSPQARRLRPLEGLETLAHSVRLELDLRFEAAAISEYRDLSGPEDRIDAPEVDWDHSAATVLTTGFIDAVPLSNRKALDEAGIDRHALAQNLLQTFIRHAIGNGFFHADMHPGNLFADPPTNGLIAVDFGIMGRIGPEERRFLANVLHGFIRRDYLTLARKHFEMGYVPATRSVEEFSLALRAIGEPLQGRPADQISMANVLGQLLAVTELFEMQARPELLLLQKTMVMVEGVARDLDPGINVWTIAEPVVEAWMRRDLGPAGRLAEARLGIERLANTLSRIPRLVERAELLLTDFETEASRPATRHWVWRASVFAIAAAALLISAYLLWLRP